MTREDREVAVDWFASRMKQKLREPKNEAKGSWRSDTFRTLLRRLSDETDELDAEIQVWANGRSNYDAIISEACDIASYAMMIADIAEILKEES